MQIGIVGMGRMGSGIARRLMQSGHECVVYDRYIDASMLLAKDGATPAKDPDEFVRLLRPPRVVWVMLPAGEATENAIWVVSGRLHAGDMIIDGGNSFYRDDIRRAELLKTRSIEYVDVGTCGGARGVERGFCMMIGGHNAAVEAIDPILRSLAPGIGSIDRTARASDSDPRPELGYLHAGPVGAGHFVKMIHIGIEYGLMQAYAEGFDVLRNRVSKDLPRAERFALNLPDIAEVWRRGSVISSGLLDLSAAALAKDPDLKEFSGFVEDTGEGRWAVAAAIEEGVPADVLTAALYARFRSRRDHTFGEKMLSAMRFGFGGHVEGGEHAYPGLTVADLDAEAG